MRRAGGSVAVTLPKQMANRLGLVAGDSVLAVETERGILLIPCDPSVEEALDIAARAARNYRNALRALAR